jgi:hypothetical protein
MVAPMIPRLSDVFGVSPQNVGLIQLVDLAMRDKDLTRLHEEWVSQARGDVFEIGIGSSLNLPFYLSQSSGPIRLLNCSA